MEFQERKRWVFLGLPFTFTVYTVREDMITVNEGFLNRKENDCYMYKVQDVELQCSVWERIFRLGTVRCFTGDKAQDAEYARHRNGGNDGCFAGGLKSAGWSWI